MSENEYFYRLTTIVYAKFNPRENWIVTNVESKDFSSMEEVNRYLKEMYGGNTFNKGVKRRVLSKGKNEISWSYPLGWITNQHGERYLETHDVILRRYKIVPLNE